LGNWVKAWRHANPEPDKALSPVERARVSEMEAEIRRLRMENEFGKKSSHGAVGVTRVVMRIRGWLRHVVGWTMVWSSGLTSPPLGAVSPEKSMTWGSGAPGRAAFERELQTP
jgi:hypothetical protein